MWDTDYLLLAVVRVVNTGFSRYMEARGRCWLSCLLLFAILILLSWDTSCWTWGLRIWLGWLASKSQELAFLSLPRARITGTGHHKPGVCWRSEHGSPRVQWTPSNPASPSFIVWLIHFLRILSIFSSSGMKHWNTQNPITLQYLSQNDFNKSLMGLLWNLSPN